MAEAYDAPARPAMRYYGSKWRLAQSHIVDLLPPHRHYVEPFAGTAAVLLNKAPSYLETYNDADGRLVNFFTMLRDQGDELIRQIELTPFARAEVELARDPSDDPMEDARRWYVLANQQRTGPVRWHSGWLSEKNDKRSKPLVANWCETYHLYQIAQRLRQVQIECDDAMEVIQRYDTTTACFYVDPPYLADTRTKRNRLTYRHEFNTEEDHRELAAVLRGLRGMVILSGYESALYAELYGDWARVDVQVRTQGHDRQAHEVIWLSPATQRARAPLFAAEVN